MARYPNGMSSFEEIRLGKYIYIDKTDYIVKMLDGAKYFFLSRPRRFGKSLFVSTLEAFFLGKKELFEGLYIYGHDWEWEEYPVIRIDFAPKSYARHEDLIARLNDNLRSYEEKYGLNAVDTRDVQVRFNRLITEAHKKSGKQVVVLVDEYEKPVVDNLDNDELKEQNREMLAGFYSVLKANDAKLKFVFLTGVTKFGQMSVFSGLNNLRDISLLQEYGAICGITEKELLDNFQEGIRDLAEAEETDFDGAVRLLKENYDGYHFSPDCPDIYNPYSIVNAMDNRVIEAYWATSGVPTLLVKTLRMKKFDLNRLDGALATAERLKGIDNQINDPIALFYQTGYLTIKNYIKKMRLFSLGFPNREVEVAFFNYLLPEYSNQNKTASSNFITDIAFGLDQGNPGKALAALQSFTAHITYEVLDKIDIEQHFQDVVYIILKALLPYVVEVKAEERTSDGRTDILIKTQDFIYIIELKTDSSAEEALRQIEEKEYALPYLSDPRKVFMIGINFSTEKRRIDSYVISPDTGL